MYYDYIIIQYSILCVIFCKCLSEQLKMIVIMCERADSVKIISQMKLPTVFHWLDESYPLQLGPVQDVSVTEWSTNS